MPPLTVMDPAPLNPCARLLIINQPCRGLLSRAHPAGFSEGSCLHQGQLSATWSLQTPQEVLWCLVLLHLFFPHPGCLTRSVAMPTSLTRPHEHNSVGRDAHQLLLSPHHCLHCATQKGFRFFINAVFSLNLEKKKIIITTVFTLSDPLAPLSTSSSWSSVYACVCRWLTSSGKVSVWV